MKVDGAQQSFLSISDNNKTSDISPHSVPVHQQGAAIKGEKGERVKRKEGSEESLGRKGKERNVKEETKEQQRKQSSRRIQAR